MLAIFFKVHGSCKWKSVELEVSLLTSTKEKYQIIEIINSIFCILQLKTVRFFRTYSTCLTIPKFRNYDLTVLPACT